MHYALAIKKVIVHWEKIDPNSHILEKKANEITQLTVQSYLNAF